MRKSWELPMPLYVYKCLTCSKEYEEISSIKDRHDTICPHCGRRRGIVIIPSVANYTFGWRLTERAHDGTGPKEEIERNI